MLAQELKRLESSLLISKTRLDPDSANIEYELTSLGQSLSNLLDELLAWGNHFRKEVIGKG
jgi:DNA-binding HxlR family transcriptional regulator